MKTAIFIVCLFLAISAGFAQVPYSKVSVTTSSKTWQETLLVLKGIMEGIELETGFEQISECITESDTVAIDLDKAIQDFKADDLPDVIAGTQLLVQALHILPSAIQNCKGAASDVEKIVQIIESITNPASFAFRAAENLIINGVDIYKEIKQAITDYDDQEWVSFGEDLGEALANILIKSPFTTTLQIKPQEVLQIVKGVLIGLSTETDFEDISACVLSGSDITTDIYQAVRDFQTEEAQQVLAGIQLIGQALEIIPNAIQECGGAEKDVENLYRVLEAFQSPTTFIFDAAKNILINGAQIYQEIDNAVADYNKRNYEGFGQNIGEALSTVLFGSQQLVAEFDTNLMMKTATQNIEMIFKGVMEGIAAETPFSDFDSCIQIDEKTGLLIASAVKNFIAETPESVRMGLIELGEALEDLPVAIEDCHGAVEDIQHIEAMINAIQNPSQFILIIGKSLIINHAEIYHLMKAAISAYQSQQWEAFGKDIGEALGTILFHDSKKITELFANFVNERVAWKASVPKKFENMTIGEIKGKYLGTVLANPEDYNITRVDYSALLAAQSIPKSFNAYEAWPECAHPIRDQGHCGSCWAFGASEAFSDRICVASNGSKNIVLSPQWLVSCNDIMNHGCNGGILPLAWLFMTYNGIVADSCLPYESYNGSSYRCPKQCMDGSAIKKYRVKWLSTKTFSNPTSIQVEIMTNGPVETAFSVYEDFLAYSGGIYTHSSGGFLGGHAVKIIGWGQENGTNYWLCANSWGTSWGEEGFFRIAWDECGIDSDAIAGIPDV